MPSTSLSDVHARYAKGEISVREMASILGLNFHSLSISVGEHGDRLRLVLETLDKYAVRAINRPEAAEVLGVTTRQVNLLCNTWGVVRAEDPNLPWTITKQKREAFRKAKEAQKVAANAVLAGEMTLADAAASCDISTRQLRRVMDALRNP